ncbi:MAG: peptide deformylase [Legionellales bacterium RIFCSPHIGHO2_12_FULL_35_11]|nr:MAG: peptide deformylase [Legionellales bacterium RIFCSPHIGHO2_12_FULL_35_11]
MEANKVIKLGNPLLRLVSEPIANNEFGTDALKTLANTLFDVMAQENGLGLAAPQIGINKRAIVFGMDKHPIHTELPPIPYTVLFNPSFVPTSDICVEDYEGCLSVGNLRGKVSRYKSIRYRGYDANGHLIEREVSDLHARAVQHELDHLNGVIFLDRITNHSSLGFHEELVLSGVLPSNMPD